MGGHYYAYIKNFVTNRWYNFNDSSVKEISDVELESVFGGEGKFGSASNAYLLMYRKVSSENILVVPNEAVPESAAQAFQKYKDDIKRKEVAYVERQLALTVHAFYKGEKKVLNVRKTDTFLELKKQIILQFAIEDAVEEDTRVRAYESYHDIMTKPYDGELENKTLSESNIYASQGFTIEMKKPDEVFQDYNPDLIRLNIVLWNEEQHSSDMLSLEQKSANPLKFYIEKTAKVQQLIAKASQEYNIPLDSVYIIRKPMNTTVKSPERISFEANMERTINSMNMYNGATIYLENHSLTSNDPSKWEEEFENDKNRISVKFNHPDTKPNHLGQVDYAYSLVTNREAKFLDFKIQMCELLGVKPENVVVRRGMPQGQEVKDEEKTLRANSIYGSNLFLSYGTPTRSNEHRLLFSLADQNNDHIADGATYFFKDLFEFPVNGKLLVSQVKELVCARATELNPELTLNPIFVRLRERDSTSDRLAKILNPDLAFSLASSPYDKRKYAI